MSHPYIERTFIYRNHKLIYTPVLHLRKSNPSVIILFYKMDGKEIGRYALADHEVKECEKDFPEILRYILWLAEYHIARFPKDRVWVEEK